MSDMLRIGLISDTHGLLRPQAIAPLRGCCHIIHGGDIGKPEILAQLGLLAPVSAVRGNNDKGPWADALPDTLQLEFAGVRLHVLHDLGLLDIDPLAAGVRVVVSGHSHRPLAEERNGVWFINPGSAGPRRFRLPVTVAELIIDGAAIRPRIVTLDLDLPS